MPSRRGRAVCVSGFLFSARTIVRPPRQCRSLLRTGAAQILIGVPARATLKGSLAITVAIAERPQLFRGRRLAGRRIRLCAAPNTFTLTFLSFGNLVKLT